MFKRHNFEIVQCNPNDPNFDLFKFLGEINLYVSKLHEKSAVSTVFNKITDDFEKKVKVTKLKEFKRCTKTFYQITKNKRIRKKLIKEMKNEKLKNKIKNKTKKFKNLIM